jgi:signal transduction histidine kinase
MTGPHVSPDIDFRSLFEAAPGLYLVLTPELRIVAASDAYLRATQTRREEIVGRDVFEVFPDNPDDPAATGVRNMRASLDRVLRSGAPDAMAVQKYDIRRAEGGGFEEHYWSPVNSPVRGADGRVAYIIHRVEDVTEFIRVKQQGSERARAAAALVSRTEEMEAEIYERAQQLQAANEELRAASEKLAASQAALYQSRKMEAIGQLTGGVAHDFNNLLTIIVGNIDLLESEAGSDERMQKLIATARRAAERGARLTAQLLAFARRQALRPETCNLNAAILELDILVKRALGESVAVRTDLNAALWPVNVDIAQFESALLNLAVNARDAMPEGGSLTIATRNEVLEEAAARAAEVQPGRYVVMSVSDTGTGMAPAVRERAFEPFYTTKEVGKGSGLGLSQLYGFVRQSGGYVALDSTPGGGTTVRLYLPVASREQPPAATEPAAPPPGKLRGSETVLVVEDDPGVLEVAVATLRDLGYRILVAHDGREALAFLERDEPIDLLFTDIVMPNGISGVALARAARKLRQDLKVLLTSGYTLQTASPEYGGAREFPVIGKPYRQTELAEQVRRALGRPGRRPG